MSLERRDFLRGAGAAVLTIAAVDRGLSALEQPAIKTFVTDIQEGAEGLREKIEVLLPMEVLQARAKKHLQAHTQTRTLNGENYTYVIPSVGYNNYWHWDNLLAAVSASYLDSELAKKILESQGRIFRDLTEYGPQIIFFNTSVKDQLSRIRAKDRVDLLTQTPVSGLALEAYWRKTGDLETVKKVLPAFAAHYRWLAENRVVDPEVGLPVTIHPYESLDAQPAVDLMYGRGMDRVEAFYIQALRSMRHARGNGFNAEKIARSGGFVMYDTCYLSFYVRGLYSLSRLYGQTGDRRTAESWLQKADSAKASFIENCFDPETGFFYNRRANRGKELLRVKTASGAFPLLLKLPENVAEPVIKNLVDPLQFLGAHVPFVAKNEPFYQNEVLPLWRGPGNALIDFAISLGLHENGHSTLAELVHTISSIWTRLYFLAKHPFPEFYTSEKAYRGPYTWGTLAACDPKELASA